MREIALGPDEYLASLKLDGDGPTEVAEVDGAALYRVADEHFVVFSCIEHKHKGHQYLMKVLPPHWVVFAEATNPELHFTVAHYGPDFDAPLTPEEEES